MAKTVVQVTYLDLIAAMVLIWLPTRLYQKIMGLRALYRMLGARYGVGATWGVHTDGSEGWCAQQLTNLTG